MDGPTLALESEMSAQRQQLQQHERRTTGPFSGIQLDVGLPRPGSRRNTEERFKEILRLKPQQPQLEPILAAMYAKLDPGSLVCIQLRIVYTYNCLHFGPNTRCTKWIRAPTTQWWSAVGSRSRRSKNHRGQYDRGPSLLQASTLLAPQEAPMPRWESWERG